MRRILVIVALVIIASYSIYQGRFLILGPQVWVDNIRNGEAVTDPVIIVAGRAKNVAWLSLNDRQIFLDKNGYWSEKLALSYGTSYITVKGKDRWGHEVYKNLQVVLN